MGMSPAVVQLFSAHTPKNMQRTPLPICETSKDDIGFLSNVSKSLITRQLGAFCDIKSHERAEDGLM